MPRHRTKATVMSPDSILRPSPSLSLPANRIGRKPLGLYPHVSRKLLAAAVGTAAETVVRVLNGSVDPTLALAGQLAKALGIGMERLMEDLAAVRRERGVKGGRVQVQAAGRAAGRATGRKSKRKAVQSKSKSRAKSRSKSRSKSKSKSNSTAARAKERESK